MKVLALEAALLGLTSWCAYCFLTTASWHASLGWWVATMISLLNFWVLGVHWSVRGIVMIASSIVLAHQFSDHKTTFNLALGLGATLVTYLLCHHRRAADTLWSVKTIVLDWLVCTLLVVVCACVDALRGTQYLLVVLSYFCCSNILSVVVMKTCEALMRWRATQLSPRVKYIHNLVVPIHILPSLHVGQLLAISWTLAFLLMRRAEHFLALPNGGVEGWQLIGATGLWSSFFAYMCPLVADKNPETYYTPQEQAHKRQQS